MKPKQEAEARGQGNMPDAPTESTTRQAINLGDTAPAQPSEAEVAGDSQATKAKVAVIQTVAVSVPLSFQNGYSSLLQCFSDLSRQSATAFVLRFTTKS